MKKHLVKRILSAMAAGAMTATLFSGCYSAKEKEQADTITVYLVTNSLYEKYAPYI